MSVAKEQHHLRSAEDAGSIINEVVSLLGPGVLSQVHGQRVYIDGEWRCVADLCWSAEDVPDVVRQFPVPPAVADWETPTIAAFRAAFG